MGKNIGVPKAMASEVLALVRKVVERGGRKKVFSFCCVFLPLITFL